MSETNPLTLEQRIKNTYQSMPFGDRQLAEVILEYPGEIVMLSATELAEKAGVSKAAVSRFVQRLGYENFKEMSTEIRQVQISGAPIFLNRSDLKLLPSSDALRQHLEIDIENLTRTIQDTDPDLVETVSRHILSANRVWCLGFRNGAFFAGYVRRQLIQIRSNVTLLPTPGQTLGEELGTADKNDLVIIVGLRRRTRELHRVMKVLSERRVPIVYFTDHHAITSTQYATYTFSSFVRGASLFDSYVGLLSLLNFVCAKTSANSGSQGRLHLDKAESMLGDLDEIDSEN